MRALFCAAVLGVGGCAAPAYVAGLRPAGGEVAGAVHAESRLRAKDGTSLLYQSWRPLDREPKAAVLVVHGLKDYSDRYAALALRLASAGFAVHAVDLRGHGDSGGDRVWVDRFDDYLDDVDVALAEVRRQDGARKVFYFGHSMGGAVVALYALTRAPAPSGLVLSAAALKVRANAFTQTSTQVLGS